MDEETASYLVYAGTYPHIHIADRYLHRYGLLGPEQDQELAGSVVEAVRRVLQIPLFIQQNAQAGGGPDERGHAARKR